MNITVTVKQHIPRRRDLREATLFAEDEGVLAPVAEQHYLAALDHLALAERHLKLADIDQARAVAAVHR